MFTHTITNKEVTGDTVTLTVEFTDGTTTLTEKVIPQDKYGLRKWVSDRLNSLNETKELKEDDSIVGTEIDLQPDNRTPAEKAFEAWYKRYRQLQQVQTLIDLGVLTGTETPVTNLRQKVTDDFKPAFINELI